MCHSSCRHASPLSLGTGGDAAVAEVEEVEVFAVEVEGNDVLE